METQKKKKKKKRELGSCEKLSCVFVASRFIHAQLIWGLNTVEKELLFE